MNRRMLLLLALALCLSVALAEGDAAPYGFGGTREAPTFLGVAPGMSREDALVLLAAQGFPEAEAAVAVYGEGEEVARYAWQRKDDPRAVRLYCAGDEVLGAGLLLERAPDDGELPGLIADVHAQLTALYGESAAPLAIPEKWPAFALRDVPLARWETEGSPAVELVWQVRREGTVIVEARVGRAETEDTWAP